MKVILNKDVKDIGKAGSLVDVSDGYARNYLFPRQLATEATPGAMKEYEERKRAEKRREDLLLAAAQEAAKQLEEAKIVVKAKPGSDGRLYGTITTKEIAEAITKQTEHQVDKRKIELADPIKTLGTHMFNLKLHPQVTAKMKVSVQEE